MKESRHWVIAALAFGLLFFMMPGINSTSNLFVVPVTEELNMSRTLYSLTFSVLYIVQFAVALFYGKIYKMVSLRTLLLILTATAVLSCVVSALAENIFMVFLGAFLRGIVMGLGMVPIAATIITNWFDKSRGLVLGIVFASSGFGGFFLMKLFTLWVNSPDVGWRLAYIYIAIVMGIPMLIASMFLKNAPEEVGLKPYGYGFSKTDSEKGSLKNGGITLKEARKSVVFYICIVIVFLVCMTINGIYLHLAAFFSDANVAMTDIGTALSLLAGGVAIGKLLYGYVSDKFGNAAVLILAAVFKASSMVFLLNYNSGILLMTGAVLLGLATGIIQMVSGLLAGLFGKGDYSSIVGVFSAAMALGMATGAYILGFVHDAKESYHNIFLIYTAAVAFAAFLGLFLNTGIKSLYRGK